MFTKVVKVALFIIYEKTTTLFISEFLRGKAVWVSVMVVPPGESCVDGCVNGVGVVTIDNAREGKSRAAAPVTRHIHA